MKMFSKDGIEMVDIKSIQRSGETLVMKGKVMGSMATTIIIRPEDCWQALKLLGWSTVLRLPALLVKGYLKSRQDAKPLAATGSS